MTKEQLEQIAMDALDVDESYGITSLETSLVQAGYRACLEEVKAEHRRLELGDGRHTFEQDWDALKEWLDVQLREAGA